MSELDISAEAASRSSNNGFVLTDSRESLAQAAARIGMVLPWVTLALMLLLTATAFHFVKSESEALALEKFEFRKTEILEAIDERMVAYTQALRGGLGLFRAMDHVTRSDWRAYVETQLLNELFPGIQGIGYAEWVRPEERAAYEARIQSEGFGGFSIRPAGDREIYSSIIFLEPFDVRNRQAFGYDMFSQETRRQAMALARDTGEVAISGKVKLVQEISADVQAGFLMYLPYYGHAATPESAAKPAWGLSTVRFACATSWKASWGRACRMCAWKFTTKVKSAATP